MSAVPRGRVLIAEDEPPIVASLEFLLNSRHIETRTASDGERALKLAREFDPHVVLLDVMLPKVSGFDVCRVLRGNPAARLPRVVFLTARGSDADIARGREAGAHLHIAKPFSTKELVGEVEKMLSEVAPDWTPLP